MKTFNRFCNVCKKYWFLVIIFVVCVAITLGSLLFVKGLRDIPSIETFSNYLQEKGLISYYEEAIHPTEESNISKYYKGSSLYDSYYLSYIEYATGQNNAKEDFEKSADYYHSSYSNIEYDSRNDDSGRFHATNSNGGEVYLFYKDNNIILVIGKTEYSKELKDIVSGLGL